MGSEPGLADSDYRRQCVPQMFLEFLTLSDNGPGVPEKDGESHYFKRIARNSEMVGQALAIILGMVVPSL